jgi:RNA polymerase sigma-70 factor, ECF subfamily
MSAGPDIQSQMIFLLQSGDEGSFEALYDAYSSMLFGIILKIVEDKREAENLLQDCFVKIWQNIGHYAQDKGKISTWMINIARNTAIDFTRSKYYNQKLKNQNLENFVHHAGERTITHPCIDTLGLRQLVQRLDPSCREVIEWMYFEGYTQQEIAENFGIPLGTVKSRTRAALRELRAYYQ